MNAIGVIPARFYSTRFPGKPLVNILGKSLIERVYNRAIKSNLNKVLIATDDDRIVREVLTFGGNVVLTGIHASGTDRVAEVIRSEMCDIVINIQGDEPLIKPEVINTVIRSLEENSWAEASTVATRIKKIDEIDNPNVVKVVFSKCGKALYFSRSRIPYNRDSNVIYYKHIGLYGYRKAFLNKFIELNQSDLEISESLEQLRIIENGYEIHVSVVESDSIGLDLPEDVHKVEEILKKEESF